MTDIVERVRALLGDTNEEQDTINEAAAEIERLREALEYLLAEVERSSADVDPCAVRDSRAALHRTEGGQVMDDKLTILDAFDRLREIYQETMDEVRAEYDKLAAECDPETKLAITAWVFRNLVKHATEGGTYRYLIYERLGFDPDAYLILMDAGGMTISNEFILEEPEESSDDIGDPWDNE
jgi:hypothetical protein